MTAYGEMDVTTIDEMPPGRLPIKTYWIRKKQLNSLMNTIMKELKKNAQIYVISPLIEESDALDLENATKLAEVYKQTCAPNYRVALLHGRMQAADKEEIMQQFKSHEIDILVSTTVIEVGVDVSNATMIVIHDTDQFWFSPTSSMRGRVGRGQNNHIVYWLLIPKVKWCQTHKIMTESTDGFKISQKI